MKDYSKYINSTGTHYIANSGGDEKKGTKGGTAGDQTGHEWELKAWYNRPWNVVLRYPDAAARKLFAEISCAAALNDKIGYDQNQRLTYIKQLEASGWNPEKIDTACEEDCTAGVTANWIAVGHLLNIEALKNLPKTIYSGNMKSNFVKAGFEALTDKKYISGYSYLLTGDVLLYTSHHAAANITKGKNAKEYAAVDEKKDVSKSVVQIAITGRSVNIRQSAGTSGKLYKPERYAFRGETYEYSDVTNVNGTYWYKTPIGWISGKYAEVMK